MDDPAGNPRPGGAAAGAQSAPARPPACGQRTGKFYKGRGAERPPGPDKTAAAPPGLWILAGEGQEITGLPGARGRRGGMEMENNRG